MELCSQTATENEKCFFKLCFSVALLNSLEKKKDDHANAPIIMALGGEAVAVGYGLCISLLIR